MSRETAPNVVRFGDAVWYGPPIRTVFLAANPETGLAIWRTWPRSNASVLEWRYEVRTQAGERVGSFDGFDRASAITFPNDAPLAAVEAAPIGGPREVAA